MISCGKDFSLKKAISEKNDDKVITSIQKGANPDYCSDETDNLPLLLYLIENHYNSETIKAVIDSGANIEVVNDNNRTPLFSAVKSGNIEIVSYLLSKGANVNARDVSGITPLMLACYNSNYQLVEFLLDNGAEPNVISVDGYTALNLACDNRDNLKIVQTLIGHNADVNLYDKKSNRSALVCATIANASEIVDLLLKNGFDVDSKFESDSNYGWTCLHVAVVYGREEIVQKLIDNHCNVNEKCIIQDEQNGSYGNALSIAISGDNSTIASLLISNDIEVLPIDFYSLCLSDSNEELIKIILQKGYNPDVQYGGNTCLMASCYFGSIKCAELLLNNGANINQKNEKGETPLMFAIYGKKLEMIEMLLRYGAKVDELSPNADGLLLTPLIYSLINNEIDIAELLLKHGANVNFTFNKEVTPILLVVANNYSADYVTLLIKYGAKLDCKLDGLSLYDYATINNNQEVMMILQDCMFKVGDRGPAGGIIVYDKGERRDGWRFIEVAPNIAIRFGTIVSTIDLMTDSIVDIEDFYIKYNLRVRKPDADFLDSLFGLAWLSSEDSAKFVVEGLGKNKASISELINAEVLSYDVVEHGNYDSFIFGYYRKNYLGSNENIPNLSYAIGSGKNNTELINKYMYDNCYEGEKGKSKEKYYAAWIADEFSYNGYDDWYLPSLDELLIALNVLYQSNLIPENLNNYSTYLTSTEIGNYISKLDEAGELGRSVGTALVSLFLGEAATATIEKTSFDYSDPLKSVVLNFPNGKANIHRETKDTNGYVLPIRYI